MGIQQAEGSHNCGYTLLLPLWSACLLALDMLMPNLHYGQHVYYITQFRNERVLNSKYQKYQLIGSGIKSMIFLLQLSQLHTFKIPKFGLL